MRIRHKPHAKGELAAWPNFVTQPDAQKTRWAQRFADPAKPLHVELGCGKGGFLSAHALQAPQNNYLGVDIKNEMLLVAKRTTEHAFSAAGATPGNILFTVKDIEFIRDVLAPEDHVQRIYINFCNPWYKSGHAKHRLTHPRQLLQYRAFLPMGGQIFFKTDDTRLFLDSLRYFPLVGFEVIWSTTDLHAQNVPNVMTEHEKMFAARGIPIKACVAQAITADLDLSAISKMKTV